MFFRYDSTHVGLHRDENVTVSETEDGKLCINGNKITVFAERDPKLIPWGAAGTYYDFHTLNKDFCIFIIISAMFSKSNFSLCFRS